MDYRVSDQTISGVGDKRGDGEVFPALQFEENFQPIPKVFPMSPSWPNHASAHHGNAINSLLRHNDYETSHVILTDSDCFPISSEWNLKVLKLLKSNDAICSTEGKSTLMTHPCFMVLPVASIKQLDFLKQKGAAGDLWTDTGRLIGVQLVDLGYKVHFLKPEKVFGGLSQAQFYLDKSIVHVGGSSFKFLRESKTSSSTKFIETKFTFNILIVKRFFWLFRRSFLIRIVMVFSIWLFLFIFQKVHNFFIHLRLRF